MGLAVIALIVTIFLVGGQNVLSRKSHWLWGAIIPCLSIALIAGTILVMDLPITWEIMLPGVFILIMEVFIWIDARKEYRRTELNKIKAQDILLKN